MLIPVILSGGAGTRLWPVSRESHPKPFIALPDGHTLLNKTYQRACQLADVVEVMTITNREYYLRCQLEFEKATHAQQQPALAQRYLLEPVSRNTAAAIILACLAAKQHYGEEAILLVMPADHLIEEADRFANCCQIAKQTAAAGKIVTFGIKPTSPETGLGYIEVGPGHDVEGAYAVKRFVEKPDRANAEAFLKSKQYFWNAGMFCFKVSAMIQEFNEHAPELLAAAEKCWQQQETNASGTQLIQFNEEAFLAMEDISIDYAIMEKSSNIAVVASDFTWRDIGSWQAYQSLHAADAAGNTIVGEAIMIDSRDTFIHSEKRMVASIGVENILIIDTDDALLVTHRDHCQDVKKVAQALKADAHATYFSHKTVERPWGQYSILDESDTFKVKRITVKPGACLSLQSHKHRSEHWIIVEGTARVTNGEKEFQLTKDGSVFIPSESVHRIQNPGKCNLVLIEVQTGNYFGEDDITRYDDIYGRVKK